MRIARQLVAFNDWMVEGVCEGLRRFTDAVKQAPPGGALGPMTAGGTLVLFAFVGVMGMFWWLVAQLVLYLNGGPFGG